MINYKVSHIPKKPGIYIWINKINGKFYLGSSVNLYNRRSLHLKEMRGGINMCGHLQAAYDKYGEDSLEFKVILICEKSELLHYEQLLLERLKPQYNKRLIACSNLGLKMSHETKEKHRKRGFSRYPKEMIKVMKEDHWLKGKHHSSETKEKLRLANLGKQKSLESRIKQSENQKGIVHYFKTLRGILTSPDGVEYENIQNLEKFSREHAIDKRRMSEFYNNKRTSWRGWKYVAIGRV